MSEVELNRMIDYTLLKPEATSDDIRRVCDEAKRHKFFSVCVNSSYRISLCTTILSSNNI